MQVFTHREQEILNLIATGYMDNEIADLLHTSETIIEKHKSNILRKITLVQIRFLKTPYFGQHNEGGARLTP